jgi:hypothetical protein
MSFYSELLLLFFDPSKLRLTQWNENPLVISGGSKRSLTVLRTITF